MLLFSVTYCVAHTGTGMRLLLISACLSLALAHYLCALLLVPAAISLLLPVARPTTLMYSFSDNVTLSPEQLTPWTEGEPEYECVPQRL
jgi:hypothetical protein